MALEAMLQQTQCLFEEREEIFMYIMKILIDREKKKFNRKTKIRSERRRGSMGNESSQAVAEELQPAYSAPPRKRRESAIENLQKRVSRYENGLAEQEHEHEHGQESKQKEKQKQRDLQVSGPREDAERQDLLNLTLRKSVIATMRIFCLKYQVKRQGIRTAMQVLVDSEEDADQGRTFLRWRPQSISTAPCQMTSGTSILRRI